MKVKTIKKNFLKALLFPIYIIFTVYIYLFKMEMEEIIESIDTTEPNVDIQEKREKLISAVIGGGKYLEKKITVETLNNMKDEEINKEFDKYEKKLGSAMVKTLGRSIVELYSTAASHFLPISPENKLKLLEDLNQDPFLDHALNKTCCELYYKYGMLLAPLTTSLTTFKYCDFTANKNGSEGTTGNSDTDFSGSTTASNTTSN